MSGLENIKSRLKLDSEKKSGEIISAAEKHAEAIIAEARAEAGRQSDETLAEAERRAGLIRQKADSAAAADERRAVLSAKSQLINEVLEKALAKLHSLDAPSYFGVLRQLALKNALPGDGVMLLNAADLKRLPADFERSLGGISISPEPGGIEDGFILKYGDVEVNCTFSAMLKASLDLLKSEAAGQLFG